MFEFVLPEGSPFTVCPKVATVGLGQVNYIVYTIHLSTCVDILVSV